MNFRVSRSLSLAPSIATKMIARAMVNRMITFQFTPLSGGVWAGFFDPGDAGGCCSDIINYRRAESLLCRHRTLAQENGMKMPFFADLRDLHRATQRLPMGNIALVPYYSTCSFGILIVEGPSEAVFPFARASSITRMDSSEIRAGLWNPFPSILTAKPFSTITVTLPR